MIHGYIPSKLSNQGGELSFGDRIGIVFDFGKIDSKYGKLENGKVVLPMLLPFGKFQVPPIANNQDEINNLAKEIRAENLDMWENALDEDIENELKTHIIFAAMGTHSSGVDIKSMEGKHWVVGVALSFMIDDLVDEMDDLEASGFGYKSVIQMLDKVFLGETDEMPIMAPKLAPLMRFTSKWLKTNRLTKNKARMVWAQEERRNAVNALAVMAENGKNGEEGLSEDTLLEYNGYLYGLLPHFEMGLLFKEGDVSKDIREDVLFRRFKICLSNAGTLMNSIVGLARDIELDQAKDTPILRDVINNGTSLQVAFDKCCKTYTDTIRDIRVLGQKLKQRYANDPVLHHAVDFGQEVVDQNLHFYLYTTRYGPLGLKIQKI